MTALKYLGIYLPSPVFNKKYDKTRNCKLLYASKIITLTESFRICLISWVLSLEWERKLNFIDVETTEKKILVWRRILEKGGIEIWWKP